MMTCKSSGIKSSSTAIVARPAMLHGITIIQASAAGTVICYDNATTNSGTELGEANSTVNASTVQQFFTHPVECLNGIYAAVTGTGATYIIHYSMM